MLLILSVYCLRVQLVPQQKGGVARPQMTLAPPPVMTLQGPTHSRIIVGQLHTGVAQHSLMGLLSITWLAVCIMGWAVFIQVCVHVLPPSGHGYSVQPLGK